MIEIKLLKPADFRDTLNAMRLPFADNPNLSQLQAEYSTKSMTKKDLDLLSKLVKAGPDHAKSIRGAWVTLAIKAPRGFWVEMDTYCIGRQPLSSTSTMHKLTSRDLTKEDFDGIREDYLLMINNVRYDPGLSKTETLLVMKKMLPESYLQTKVVQFNYQSLRNIYKQRHNHRLPEWREFCRFIEGLDYAEELIL